MTRLLLLLSLLLGAARGFAEPVRDQHVTAELVSEDLSFQPGRTFWVAINLAMDEGWHTYWQNPGDSGLGTTVDWDLPEGFKAGRLNWPYPKRIVDGPLVSYGYENAVLLLTQITPPAAWTGGTVRLRARVGWLMCNEMCIPGNALVTLDLQASSDVPSADPRWAMPLAAAREMLPAEPFEWVVAGDFDPNFVVIRFTPRGEAPPYAQDDFHFFPYQENVIDYLATQELSRAGRDYLLKIKRAAPATKPDGLQGILLGPPGWIDGTARRSLLIDIPSPSPATTTTSPRSSLTLMTGLLAMFIGGMLLNLMPCVFPVLSLKIVNLVEQSRETRESAIKHAMAFTGGVLLSMWVLAAILLTLRSGGSTAGWAFQMSNPAFVLGLTVLFLLIGLNMFGVFEAGLALTSAGAAQQAKKGLFGSFASGLLTTVAGAPCAGPFLGTAIGFALAQPAGVALLAFTAMGLGTAAPYALLSTYPRLLNALPRPGAWMETMKQFMAFPMLITAAWFASVFAKLQGGGDILFRLLVTFILTGAAAWCFGKWSALHRAPAVRWLGRFAALLLLALGIRHATQKEEMPVEPWSKARVEQLRQAGQPVLVDFTADWCAICQVNKRIALESDAVRAKLKEKGVTVLIADWTDQNATVAAGLAEFGRAAVPLYLLYGRDPSQPPQILPQSLTSGIVLEALNKL